LDRSDLVVDDYTIDVFKERFASLCAGAYAHIHLTAPVDVCDNYEPYETVTEPAEYDYPSAMWVGNTILTDGVVYTSYDWGFDSETQIELVSDNNRQLRWIIEGATRGDGEFNGTSVFFQSGHNTVITIYNEDKSKSMTVYFNL
jgi:hypothetical protein